MVAVRPEVGKELEVGQIDGVEGIAIVGFKKERQSDVNEPTNNTKGVLLSLTPNNNSVVLKGNIDFSEKSRIKALHSVWIREGKIVLVGRRGDQVNSSLILDICDLVKGPSEGEFSVDCKVQNASKYNGTGKGYTGFLQSGRYVQYFTEIKSISKDKIITSSYIGSCKLNIKLGTYSDCELSDRLDERINKYPIKNIEGNVGTLLLVFLIAKSSLMLI